jgi:hypothetical protein
MSAIEKTYQSCLDPEAYMRIIKRCNNQEPKFRSSVYPKNTTQKQKPKNK